MTEIPNTIDELLADWNPVYSVPVFKGIPLTQERLDEPPAGVSTTPDSSLLARVFVLGGLFGFLVAQAVRWAWTV